jgi:hypothetical protein
MKLDINEIYHNYITRIIIFSVFAHKSQIRKPGVYILSVISFVKKRIPWDIHLDIQVDMRYNKDTERDIIIDNILNDSDDKFLPMVTVIFRSPLKEATILIDIQDPNRYEKHLYN